MSRHLIGLGCRNPFYAYESFRFWLGVARPISGSNGSFCGGGSEYPLDGGGGGDDEGDDTHAADGEDGGDSLVLRRRNRRCRCDGLSQRVHKNKYVRRRGLDYL